MVNITSAQWQAMLDAADESERPFFHKLFDDAVQREREAAAAARAAKIADQVALFRIPEANADRFQEGLAAAVAALVRLRTLEDLESRVTALEQRNQELQAELLSLKQSQLSAPHPPNPRPVAVPTSQSNTVLVARASGTVTSAGTGASSSSGSAGSSALVIVPSAGTSAQNATVLTGVQYSGPVVDKRAATLPSKYDGKADITSWISSMRSYFEVMRTPQEDRSMIMGTNIEPAVQNHIELQAVAAGYERIDLTEWLKVTPVRTLEDLLLARYQDKHAALKTRMKLEALKGQTWRSSRQVLEQHLTGLFTTPDLGMTDVSCMDVVMGVAPKEYLSLLGLKDHTTWRELMKDLVNLEAKDLARCKKAPAAGGKPQRKRFGSSNQLALYDHWEAEDQSYEDDMSLDDDLQPDSDMGCSTSAIESDVNEDEKLNAFRKTASNKGPNRGSGKGTVVHLPKNARILEKPEDASTKPWEALGLFSTAGKQAKGVEESSTLPTTTEVGTSVAGPSDEPESYQQPTLEARNDVESKAAAIHVLYTEPWEESKEVDFHAHMEHWLQLKQQRRVQGSVELTFFKLLINRRYIRVLIDSGSTTNFFSPNGIRKAGLGMKQVELQNPCQTQVGNQEVVTSTHAVKGVRVAFDKDRTVTHELNFYVMDKCPFDAVIGLGWLKAHCLRTTWADNQFAVRDAKGNEHTVLLDETCESPVTLLSATKFCKSVRRRKEIEHVHVAFVKPIHGPSTFAAFSTSSNFLSLDEDDPPPEVPTNIRQLLDRFPEVLAEPRGVPERPVKHKIEIIEGSVPPRGRVYRMGQGELEELRRQIDDMIDRGWIRPSESKFGAPVLLVPKKGGKLRMCIDYRGLNRITRKNAYPLPRIDDMLDAAGGCKLFSKIDLKSGYHQIEVDPSDQHKTAFKTRDGLYEFIVMPFGLINAPSTFQCLMDKVLHHQLNRFVVVYLDDILIFSKTMEEHLKHLEEVLQVLKEAQLHLNLEKSEFWRDSVIYLGHRLSANGLEPEATKVEVIRNWPQPTNVRKLRSFLGLASYYRKFVPKFSVIAHPLSRLTSKNVAYAWCAKCETAFQALKEALVSHPVLHIADPNLTFVVTTDASQFGIGAVLQQDDGDGLHPLEYYSKRMPSHKVATSTYMRELYALREALAHWKHYLLGRHFKVYSDHQTLQWIQTQSELSPTLTRWLRDIDVYSFELKHKKGCYNRVADALSRYPEFLTCLVCQRTKVHRHKPYGLLRPLPIPDGPGESISIDFTDMGKVSEAGNSQVMVIVDRFSKFMNLIPFPPHAPTELVIEEFHQQYILQFGIPKTIVSDRDTRFISKDWKDFTSQIYDIKLNKTSGRHPEANGLAEEINQTVIQLLRALIVPDQNKWDKELHKVKGLYNNFIHSATGVTPNQLQFGWSMRNPLLFVP
ncbi:hypothetical protein CBR_g38874 [Chara braunii]|uniref:Reverse transcriptase n=1 Tax=Chara braunii TaxID=69332 RepID=A0A388LQP4_CHABU|nr:hypothetical protein CBR_g38874 [Chara braunii]|eukprot:GBG84591.1 hypothetical protein CBR_g38874 [Chara braunii]